MSEAILSRAHEAGCPLVSLWTAKGEKEAGDADFAFDGGEIGSVQRLFKSKAPAVRIGGNNHIVAERKTGKMPVIFASCSDYNTNVVLIDTRKYIVVAQYSSTGKSDKEKRDIHDLMEQLGQDIMNKKI